MDEYTPESPQELERVLRVLKVPDTYHPVIFSLIGGDVGYLSFITESDLTTAAAERGKAAVCARERDVRAVDEGRASSRDF